jgi:UDP-glucuronate 4-epimerase
MPTVLITGSAGFIGMHTAIRFLKEGWDIVALDNFNDYYSVSLKNDRVQNIRKVANDLGLKFEIFTDDLNSSIWDSLQQNSFDAVVHLAAQAGVRYSLVNPKAYFESNLLGFQNVIDFVKKCEIKRFVYASSSSVYGQNSKQPFNESEECNSPESYYAATKKANELIAKVYKHTYGISSIGLRFFTVYGPWGRPDMAPMLFASAAFNNKPVNIFNYGNQKRDFTYIDDIVDGIFGLVTLQEFTREALVCNIGKGSPISLLEFVKLIEDNSGYELSKNFIESQVGDVSETYADISRINDLIGYRPKTSIEVGVKKFIDWYKEYYKV